MILEKEQVNKCFKAAPDQWAAFFRLHQLLVPLEQGQHLIVNEFPRAGEQLVDHIFHEFIQFDKKIHPDVLSGGLWMNCGWAIDKELRPWEVIVDQGAIEVKDAD